MGIVVERLVSLSSTTPALSSLCLIIDHPAHPTKFTPYIHEHNTQVTALIKTHGIPAALLNSTTTETVAKQIYRDIYGLRYVIFIMANKLLCVDVVFIMYEPHRTPRRYRSHIRKRTHTTSATSGSPPSSCST